MEINGVCGACGEEAVVIDEKSMLPKANRHSMGMAMEPDMAGFIARRKKLKKRRLRSMGVDESFARVKGKSAEEDTQDVFHCAMERKVNDASQTACSACPGGCMSEKGLPELLEIEGWAEELFEDVGAQVKDSGYSNMADMFVVQMERKDGKMFEAFFDGTTAEPQGWTLMNDGLLSQKSLEGVTVIGLNQASDIAVKGLQAAAGVDAEVGNVDAADFEGQDSWVVEMKDAKGNEYDVFVALDGTVLGYDLYTKDDSEGVETDESADEVEPEDKESKVEDDEVETANDDEKPELEVKGEDEPEEGVVTPEGEGSDLETEDEEQDEEKRAFAAEEREKLAKAGKALSDGSFPIENEADLKNAIRAVGRASNVAAARRHIRMRAKALGLESMLPEEWKQKSDDEPVVTDLTVEYMKAMNEFTALTMDS